MSNEDAEKFFIAGVPNGNLVLMLVETVRKDVANYANEKRLLGTDSIAFNLFPLLLGGSTLLDAAVLFLFTRGGNRCLLLFLCLRLFG